MLLVANVHIKHVSDYISVTCDSKMKKTVGVSTILATSVPYLTLPYFTLPYLFCFVTKPTDKTTEPISTHDI
jgi:hypothetical protein